MAFFKCFQADTITILAKECDSQDHGTTLRTHVPLTGPMAPVLPAKDDSMHIQSWTSEASREVVVSVLPDAKKGARKSHSLVLNYSHHVRNNNPVLPECLGDRIRSGTLAWNDTLSTPGGAIFVEGYWEWLEDVLSRSKDVLTHIGIYLAVYASLFSYDHHPPVLRAFLEHWCSATNTLHTAQGEMSISLRDLYKIGCLPVIGNFYDEVVPSAEEFSSCDHRGLPFSCRYLFWAYHKLSQDAPSQPGVTISSWIRFWYWEDMKYKRPSTKGGRNKTTRPKGDSDPSGIIGAAGRRTPAELRAFEDVGVSSKHLEESYLAAFLACWLCKFVFPKDDVNFIRPGVFKVASKMAAGEAFSLAIPVLALIYEGLSVISNSAITEDPAAVLPYHYVYGWLGEYFGTHFSPSALCKQGFSMVKHSGALFAKNLDNLQVEALFSSCEGLKMSRLAKGDSVRRGFVDDAKIHFSELSYLICLRSGYLSLRQEDRCIIQPYSPHRFSRQFGFVQRVPGNLEDIRQLEPLQAVYMHWESCTRTLTNTSIMLPAMGEFKSHPVTRNYADWWSEVYCKKSKGADDTNSSCSRHAVSEEVCYVPPTQPVSFERSGPTPLRNAAAVLASQCLPSPSCQLDVGDEVGSCGDGLAVPQDQKTLGKRPFEGASTDGDTLFNHKRTEVIKPFQPDGRPTFEEDAGPSHPFDPTTAGFHHFTDMSFAEGLLSTEDIEDPLGAGLAPIFFNSQSLVYMGEHVQETVSQQMPLPASSEISLGGPNPSGTDQFLRRCKLSMAMVIKRHIEKRILKCPVENLVMLKEDFSKLISSIDELNVDSSIFRGQLAGLMDASTDYSSLLADKLSPEARVQQLAKIDSSLVQVRSSRQAVLGENQGTESSLASVDARLNVLIREQGLLGIEASHLRNVLAGQSTTLSQYQEEISCLEQEQNTVMELPILSPVEVEALTTLKGLYGNRLRIFRDLVFE